MQPFVEPLVVSWGYESQMPSASRFIDEQEWNGTRDIAAYLSVPDAIQFYRQHDWDAIRMQCHALAQYARERIGNVVRGSPSPAQDASLPPHICPDSTEWYMQMFAVPLPPSVAVEANGQPPLLQKRLFDEFKVEVPVIAWQGKPYLRVSIQAYNSKEDVDRLVDALGKLLLDAD